MGSPFTPRGGDDASTVEVDTSNLESVLRLVRVGLLLICDESTDEGLEVFSVALGRVEISNGVWLLELEIREVFSVAVAARVSDEVWLLATAIRVIAIVSTVLVNCSIHHAGLCADRTQPA